jgi:inosine-uridine nucleoside N-ribohydrolase
LIAEPLQTYAIVQTVFDGRKDVSIPDVAAAMYALDSSLGTAESALVKVVTEPSLARGQTVIGLTPNERLSMIASDAELNRLAQQAIADPTFNLPAALDAILAREPYNAQLVTDIEEQRMRELFFSALAPSQKTVSVPEPSFVLSVLGFSAFGVTSLLKRKQKKEGKRLKVKG